MIYQRYGKWMLIGIGLIAAFMLYQVAQLQYDYDFEKFFPVNDEDTDFFLDYRDQFGTDNDYVLIGLKNEAGVFQQNFLQKVDSLTRGIENLAEVKKVLSPTNLQEYRRYQMHPALIEVPYLHWNDTSFYVRDSLRIFKTPELTNTFFSVEHPAIVIYVEHTSGLTEDKCQILAKELDALGRSFGFDEVHFAGRSYGQSIYIDLIAEETLLFVTSSVLLVLLFLIIAYRSFWGIWMPLSVVGLTVLFAVGMMVSTGKDMDLISNVLPTILMVIGIADVIHLLTNYLNRRREEKDRGKALMHSIREVGFATILTTVTTMIGFLTLLNSNVQPVIDLGIYASIGLVIAFLLTYTWFPSVLMLHKNIVPPSEKKKSDFWKLRLIGVHRMVLKHKVKILLGSAMLLGIGIWGTSKIEKNNYILEDLKSDHFQVKDYRFFEEKFAGARPFEMAVWLKDTQLSVFDGEVLAELAKVDRYLQEEYGVGALVSPVILVKNTNQVLHGGRSAYYKVPQNKKKLARLEKDIIRYAKQMELERYLNLDQGMMRLSGNIPDWGSLYIRGKNDSLHAFMQEQVNLDLIDYRITGSATLVDINTQFVSSNVVEGLFLAFLLIGLLVGILFRSVKMALISLVPNVLPLLLTGSIMGFFGIDLKLSTSIIFIISFGIAVDDSIHFLSRLKFELNRPGTTLRWALKKTYLETGKAITITTLILSGGFLTLCFSDFLGTFYIGMLISITLLAAWVLDLLLLPALILVFYSDSKK